MFICASRKSRTKQTAASISLLRIHRAEHRTHSSFSELPTHRCLHMLDDLSAYHAWTV